MSKTKLYLYAVISGLLLGLAWIPHSTGLVLLIAFVPLLAIEQYFCDNQTEYTSKAVVKYAIITFILWNIVATWWIKNASFVGMLMAILINTLLFTLVFWFFHFTKRKLGNGLGYFSFIVYWLTFEHFYLNAEISWPWLTLGYGFAEDIKLIQWYEYTGSLGGSLWVLMANIVIFQLFKKRLNKEEAIQKQGELLLVIIVVLLPILVSLIRFYTYKEEKDPYDIVIVQPNIDPYLKFNDVPSEEVTQIMIHLADSLADKNTDYIVAPETAINNRSRVENLMATPDIRMIDYYVKKFPKLKFVVGLTCMQQYTCQATPTASPIGNTGFYYDTYNSAIQIDPSDSIQIYHKSKLVVGVEKMPYPQYLQFLRNLTLKLGGYFRSHGTQKERSNFISGDGMMSVAPVICYESVFGEYVTDYIKKGAGFIFIITNDGWWGDTPGYKQHNSYASIRAIENRRSIARSANTGISSFVNQRGEMLQTIGWWKRSAIKATLNANHKITFYTAHGDYIARIARFFSLITVLYLIVHILMSKKKKNVH